jgi:hypothetical protein
MRRYPEIPILYQTHSTFELPYTPQNEIAINSPTIVPLKSMILLLKEAVLSLVANNIPLFE